MGKFSENQTTVLLVSSQLTERRTNPVEQLA
jgi:hypothetical protein